jgi:Ca-activated chloride channel family protein
MWNLGGLTGCGGQGHTATSPLRTFAELRAIKGDVTVTPMGEGKRQPFPHERVSEGATVTVGASGLAWLRRDAGALWLMRGPAEVLLRQGDATLKQGRVFIDGADGATVVLDTPRGKLELSDTRASVEVRPDGSVEVYVLRGAALATNGERASAGERLTWVSDDGYGVNGHVTREAAVAWDDWTGGLATADADAEAAPFGLGTVGARPPGDQGKPRFSLVVERLDVRVTVDHDFAVTEVDETFVNPSAATVEGIYGFRTPAGAVLSKFGVDRDGSLVWGRIKESAAAKAQYESNVYQGSTEDPALLSWVSPGVYNARLYPIAPGARRRVVTRYTEWLSRQGPKGERRLYVYPMAAEGARSSLPRIEEMRVTLDLAKAGARTVRAGMGGRQDGQTVTIQAFDFVPRADLAVELLDDGESDAVAYRAPHKLNAQDIPLNADPAFAAKVASEEPDYLLVPLRSEAPNEAEKGVDLAIVVDTSAATEPFALSIARNLTSALLAHLGEEDRAALFTGDTTLRPVVASAASLTRIDATTRREWLAGLANAERGGASDLGALLTDAAAKLDPKRRGAVLYIGDGLPSVGETSSKPLRERFARLPQGTRIFAAGVGSHPNMALLAEIARGAPVESIGDAYSAAQSALRLLEHASRPAWVGAQADLGTRVDRIFPRELPPVPADESLLAVGRLAGKPASQLKLSDGTHQTTRDLRVVTLDDEGDLRRRWGQGRMGELLTEGAGRAALVDVARRYGLVSPYTSLYVPTARELATETTTTPSQADLRAEGISRRSRWRPWTLMPKSEPARASATRSGASLGSDKEEDEKSASNGFGTRAKGEETEQKRPAPATHAAASAAPDVAGGSGAKRNAAEYQEFGMIGLLGTGAGGGAASADKVAPAEPLSPPPAMASAANAPLADAPSRPSAYGAGGLGLSGVGGGEGVGLGNIGTIGHGAGTGAGMGFGAGAGRLSGAHATSGVTLRQGTTQVQGKLPSEVVQRIVRQNFGRLRLCYENGLRNNPNLMGTVSTRFVIDRSGAVASTQDAGSTLPDGAVVQCVVRSFSSLSFPIPESGIVTATYPIVFSPDGVVPRNTDAAASGAAATVRPAAKGLGVVGHTLRPCGPGADLALSERRTLWSERLANPGSAAVALGVYARTLEDCEAPTWRERTSLLLLMIERLPNVRERVALWKSLVGTVAADVVYRAILVRIKTVTELHELHQALGLSMVDPDLLKSMVAKAKSPADKLAVLRAAATKWPDDLELGLRVLDAYEDAGDEPGLRAWARKLRKRPDATAHVWTEVGEHYLRLATRGTPDARARDTTEAKRTFGELVEFAPDDPAARRRLGDILRAHGWHEEALRQYLTLQTLAPDDATVPLLLALATYGMGRVEEAVGWAEKAIAAGSPDGASSLSKAARAHAVAFLAWAREDALKAGKKDDAERLAARAQRLLASSADVRPDTVHVLVTWTHAELHPALWTTQAAGDRNALPAPGNYPLFGVAEARVPKGDIRVELRTDPEEAAHAARLGLTATVTLITGAGNHDVTVMRTPVSFGTKDAAFERRIVTLENGALRVGNP